MLDLSFAAFDPRCAAFDPSFGWDKCSGAGTRSSVAGFVVEGGLPGMPHPEGAFALPYMQPAFGKLQACVREVASPRIDMTSEMGHVDLPGCASTTTALPFVDLDCQPLATHV